MLRELGRNTAAEWDRFKTWMNEEFTGVWVDKTRRIMDCPEPGWDVEAGVGFITSAGVKGETILVSREDVLAIWDIAATERDGVFVNLDDALLRYPEQDG